MQTELRLARCTTRPAAIRNRVSLQCEQLEGRDAPSVAPLAAFAVSAPANISYAAVTAAPEAAASSSHDVFALGGAADSGNGLSDAAYAKALQNHAAAVFQEFATPAAVNGTRHVAAKATTWTTLSASTHTATVGEKVMLTAKVTASWSSARLGGTVTFKDGNRVLGTAALDAHGAARLTTSALTQGTHHLTADYGGNNHFKGSTSTVISERVTPAPKPVHRPVHKPVPTPAAEVLLENVGHVTTAGNPLVLEATVKGSRGGSVTILDGSHMLGQIELDRSGHAALAVNLGLPAGRHTLTAVYQNGSVHASGSVSVTLAPSAWPMW
jgi:hypothetical protein